MLVGNEANQSLEDNLDGRSPSTVCGKDQRGKDIMFHLKNSLLICSPFLSTISAVCGTLVDDEMLEEAKELKILK